MLAYGENARILESISFFEGLIEIHTLNHSHEATHKHTPNKADHVFERANSTHHAYEHCTDWHEQHKDYFAKEIVYILNEAHLNK